MKITNKLKWKINRFLLDRFQIYYDLGKVFELMQLYYFIDTTMLIAKKSIETSHYVADMVTNWVLISNWKEF